MSFSKLTLDYEHTLAMMICTVEGYEMSQLNTEVHKVKTVQTDQIHTALNRSLHVDQPDNKPISVPFLPFVGAIFNCISTVLI
jgi:hypothetical protein